jgi:hypothetical protein
MFCKTLAVIAAGGLGLCGQTREATIEFISREIRSLETRTRLIPEAAFSQDGATFSLRRRELGGPERALVVPLAHVDIYAVRVRVPVGPEHYDLVLRCRGREAAIQVNALAFNGRETLLGGIESRRQALALERAFAHLTGLTTGRKDPFAAPALR